MVIPMPKAGSVAVYMLCIIQWAKKKVDYFGYSVSRGFYRTIKIGGKVCTVFYKPEAEWNGIKLQKVCKCLQEIVVCEIVNEIFHQIASACTKHKHREHVRT